MIYYIIGSGIIGLSVAEYLTHKGKSVVVISNDHPLSGSKAAAANLATKGQLFARDSHFQLKLDGKKIYSHWINRLENEISYENKTQIYKFGLGTDIFLNSSDRDRQLKRVLQNKEDLISKNLSTNAIESEGDNAIIYKEEAWVNASELLKVLKFVLIKRGVNFISESFSKKHLTGINSGEQKVCFILCTGAWTKDLLKELQWPLPKGMSSSERMTIGSTFNLKNEIKNKYDEIILQEKINENFSNKVTWSGDANTSYLSSTSLKISSDLSSLDLNRLFLVSTTSVESSIKSLLETKNKEFLDFALEDKKISPENLEIKTGLRVGYGHSEIIIEKVHFTHENYSALVCCGAHKSGFLFAPVLGEIIEKILV